MWTYIKSVLRVWAKFIAGPAAAIASLGALVYGLTHNLTPTETSVWSLSPLVVAFVLIWPAQYSVWKDEHQLRVEEQAKHRLPEIFGEFYDLSLIPGPNVNPLHRFYLYCCVRHVKVSVKTVIVTVYDILGNAESIEADFNFTDDGDQTLEPGIGRYAKVLGRFETSYAKRMAVTVVDAFGGHHQMNAKGPFPLPFSDMP
jgi:hypothetical protein